MKESVVASYEIRLPDIDKEPYEQNVVNIIQLINLYIAKSLTV